jgi:hypothetical protein
MEDCPELISVPMAEIRKLAMQNPTNFCDERFITVHGLEKWSSSILQNEAET